MLSIDLLINPDWPTLATVDLIHIALNKIESLERSEETKKFIGNLKNKVESIKSSH